jgi:hypothetical protein
VNYCRNIKTRQVICFSGAMPKLRKPEHEYAFWAVPKGRDAGSFFGAVIGEDPVEYGHRVRQHFRKVHPRAQVGSSRIQAWLRGKLD